MSLHPIEILVENRGRFFAFLLARVPSRPLAEDILQDAFARALERVAELRSPESTVPWFFQILRNAVVEHHRRNGASERALERLAREMPEEVAAEEPPRRVCPCVARLAAALKPEYAAALQRVEVDAVPVKKLAEELGITSSNAAVRVFRAREALRRKVTITCGACAAAGCFDCACAAPATA